MGYPKQIEKSHIELIKNLIRNKKFKNLLIRGQAGILVKKAGTVRLSV